MIELRIERAQWCEEAAQMLAPSLRRTPLVGLEDYRQAIDADPVNCGLYRIVHKAQTVLYCIVRIEHFSHGAEGVILAAAGRSTLFDLTDHCVPIIEKMFRGVSAFRISTARRGLKKKLEAQGYSVTHYILKKAAA